MNLRPCGGNRERNIYKQVDEQLCEKYQFDSCSIWAGTKQPVPMFARKPRSGQNSQLSDAKTVNEGNAEIICSEPDTFYQSTGFQCQVFICAIQLKTLTDW